MNRLPPHHVPRPRLTNGSAGFRVVVVEAAAGYGKSVLAAELVDNWRSVGIDVQLENPGVSAPRLAGRLLQAVRRAGFTEAASAAEGKQDPVDLLGTLVGSLVMENCAFVIDDAHNAEPGAGELIYHLVNLLDRDQRLIVLARRLPAGTGRLRRADYLLLSAADLALLPEETLELCRAGFGLEVGPKAAEALDKATGRWTAATVLAVARAARTGEAVTAVAEAAAGPGHPAGAVAAILEEALAALGPACRPPLAQVARLPLLDAELVGIVGGDEGFFERAFSAGIPFTPILVDWCVHIDFPSGQFAQAMERIDQALLLVPDRPSPWGFVMIWRAMLAAELGQADLCRDSVEEVFRVAELKKSPFLRAQGHWRLAVLSSYAGDADATLHHVRQVELHGKTWLELGSGEFLSDAADLLDRVGHTALADEYLARVKAEPKDAGHLVALADAVVEARHGDPEVAEARLLAVVEQRLDPREQWRACLLRAFAAFRGGQDGVAAVLAAQAFEEAARLGQPLLPLVRERAITEQLLGLAAGTEQPAALALRASALPMSLAVLGRFELTIGGRPVPLRPGQETQLLKFVTVSGGRVHAEQAIEALWPEVARSAGRNRLRTVLNRLRATAGTVLYREGEVLALDSALQVDLQELLSEARRAQSLASKDLGLATAVARGAMARYRGELLPDDRYDDWAEKPRQEAKLVMLELLDLCATEAARRGDLDALRRAVERTIEFAPYDDVRYLRAASTLLEQGRRGEALAVVNRARSAFAQLGLGPPRSLLELERSIVA